MNQMPLVVECGEPDAMAVGQGGDTTTRAAHRIDARPSSMSLARRAGLDYSSLNRRLKRSSMRSGDCAPTRSAGWPAAPVHRLQGRLSSAQREQSGAEHHEEADRAEDREPADLRRPLCRPSSAGRRETGRPPARRRPGARLRLWTVDANRVVRVQRTLDLVGMRCSCSESGTDPSFTAFVVVELQ